MTDEEQTEKETAILKPRNGFALTGFILGIASVLLASIGIIPILAIIFSGIGLGKVKDRSDKACGTFIRTRLAGRSLVYKLLWG